MRPNRHALLAIAVSGAVALAACAGAKPPAPGRVPDAAAPPRSAFEAYPAAEVAGVKNPHSYKGKPLCQRCHAPDLGLVKQANALCTECHTRPHESHPVDVVQQGPSGNLPLLAGGRTACHTCHDPHRAKATLRMPVNALCRECHQDK
ncbi:MAG TPA: cytochrome c3 family protein [Anaeromyxobacter sp.]